MENEHLGLLEVEVHGVAAGGDGVGRLPDGRAVFVRGALPGERVEVLLTERKPRFARATTVEVLRAAPSRVAPPCPLVAAGCGGCGWQHVDPAAQRELKAGVVADALTRIGHVAAVPEIDPGPELGATSYRTTVRAAVTGGVAGLRVHHGHDLVALNGTGCLVAHPLVDEVLRLGRFPGAAEVVVRAGAATGERLVVVGPTLGDAVVPEPSTVVGSDALAAGRRAWFHEEVAGRRWRISAGSFFQARPDGAAALAELVAAKALDLASPSADQRSLRVVDLYGGVGLLGGVIADRAAAAGRGEVGLELVEANRGSVADARVNLAGNDARIVGADVRRWRPSAADIVVADPSRHGLGAGAVDRILATHARTVVLVSCDPAALGRDAGLLAAGGLRLASVTLVDLFPQTPHVEVITTWTGH